MRKITKRWTTKNGTKIRICDMSADHLLNTIKMLRRKAQLQYRDTLKFFLHCPLPNGEMAELDFDNITESVIESDWSDYVPDIYWNLCTEAARRGLRHDA